MIIPFIISWFLTHFLPIENFLMKRKLNNKLYFSFLWCWKCSALQFGIIYYSILIYLGNYSTLEILDLAIMPIVVSFMAYVVENLIEK